MRKAEIRAIIRALLLGICYIPVWAAVPTSTFGLLSLFYGSLHSRMHRGFVRLYQLNVFSDQVSLLLNCRSGSSLPSLSPCSLLVLVAPNSTLYPILRTDYITPSVGCCLAAPMLVPVGSANCVHLLMVGYWGVLLPWWCIQNLLGQRNCPKLVDGARLSIGIPLFLVLDQLSAGRLERHFCVLFAYSCPIVALV